MSHMTDVAHLLDSVTERQIKAVAGVIRECDRRGGMVYVCGNGGSAATASHFACDLQKASGIHAVCLSDATPLLTALANDEGYETIFMRQLMWRLTDRDMLMVLSCSGTSPNVYKAAQFARERNVPVVALTGAHGFADGACDVEVRVPSTNYPQIEDVHSALCHAIAERLKDGAG